MGRQQLGADQRRLPRHRPNLDRIADLRDPGQVRHAPDVDDMVDLDIAYVEHRHERLPAGKDARVAGGREPRR